ncbi:MAG: hypothetical protein IBJ11_05330 [Phycisphaerales bacterium]|nr:hypothetical protein [Phycisphaerales bacterium]
MSQTNVLMLLAGAAITTVAPAALAEGQAPANRDEIRAIVSEVLADADSRSSLMQSSGAGYDSGFVLGDASGNFKIRFNGLVQFRYNANFRRKNASADAANPNGRSFTGGFQTNYTRLGVSGNIAEPNLIYEVRGVFDRGGSGAFNLENAFVGYKWDGWMFRWGQFKTAFYRESNVDVEYQLTAGRSLTNQVFEQGYSQGMELSYTADDWRVMFAFTDGFRSANSDFGTNNRTSGALTAPNAITLDRGSFGFAKDGGEGNYAVTLRGEYKFAGKWDDFKDFTGMPGKDFAAMIGAAGHIQGSRLDLPFGNSAGGGVIADGAGNPYLGDTILGSWTVDANFKGDGWNAAIGGIGSHTRTKVKAPAGSPDVGNIKFNDYGVFAQFGIFIPGTQIEPFVRWDCIVADKSNRDLTSGNRWFNTITVGGNYYIHGQAAKLTVDLQWFINRVNTLGVPDTAINYLSQDRRNEIAVRFQFQLLF